jgi:hypothetical protein
MLSQRMPTRDAARPQVDDDEVCDLDVILSRRVTFIYRGRAREILPITTERLFAFWSAVQEYKNAPQESVESSNAAFFGIVKTVCADLTAVEAAGMSVVQKVAWLEHIARKITGQKPLTDELKKKVTESLSSLTPSSSSPKRA